MPDKVYQQTNPSVSKRIREAGGLGMSKETKRWLGADATGPLGALNRGILSIVDVPIKALEAAGHTAEWAATAADNASRRSGLAKRLSVAGNEFLPGSAVMALGEAFPWDSPMHSAPPAAALASRASSAVRKAAPKAAGVIREVSKDTSGEFRIPRGNDRLPNAPAKAVPDPVLRGVAEDYAKRAGLKYTPPPKHYDVDPARGARVARAYDAMRHAPDDPRVKSAYQALTNETMGQYRALKDAGYNFEFNPASGDPYGGNPWEATRDINANRHLFVFPTDDGFGTLNDAPGNPLLDYVQGETWNGKPVRANDVFRAVHDAFGHAKEGLGFRAAGEENAYLQHAAMFSPEARHALASETRGQNSWLNFGPYGEKNRTAKVEDTIFADQKTGLLPRWAMEEGTEDFLPREMLNLQHFSHVPDLTATDPAFRGTNPNRGFTSRDDLARGPMTDFGVNTGQPGGYRIEGGVGPHAYEAQVPRSAFVEVGSPEWAELVQAAKPMVRRAEDRTLAKLRGQPWDGPGDEEWQKFTSRLPSRDNGVGLLDGMAKDRGYSGILYPSDYSSLGSIAKSWDTIPVLRQPRLDKSSN